MGSGWLSLSSAGLLRRPWDSLALLEGERVRGLHRKFSLAPRLRFARRADTNSREFLRLRLWYASKRLLPFSRCSPIRGCLGSLRGLVIRLDC